MHKVVSSNISSAGYDEETKTLRVTFTSGKTYEYADVPKQIYEGLFSATSAGKFFRTNVIDRRFKSKKI
jgi:hypothetical protein